MTPQCAARFVTLTAMCLVPALLSAQGVVAGRSSDTSALTVAPRPTGSVTGTVIDQDTQRPVRLAYVSLQPVLGNQSNGPREGFMIRGGAQRSGLDGTFTIEGVGPGDYYVIANATGYIPERALLLNQIAGGARLDDVLRQVPTVHVDSGAAGPVVVTMEHGGAISGRVQWDDGSPAGGVQMTAQLVRPPDAAGPSSATALVLPISGGNGALSGTVDDRGDFRLSGMASGDYIVTAMIVPEFMRNGPTFPIRIYSPGVFRRSEAVPITARAGDERTDVRMVLRLNGLRNVSGTVDAASGSAGVHSGSVTLADATDSTLRLAGSIATDGSFTIRYVPPGNYTMTVLGSSQEQNGYHRGGNNSGDTTIFAPLTQPLQVGSTDMSGLAINLAAH